MRLIYNLQKNIREHYETVEQSQADCSGYIEMIISTFSFPEI